MCSVDSQNQKALHEAINTQIMPQIQNTIKQVQNASRNNRNVPVEIPEQRPEDIVNQQIVGPTLFQKYTLQDSRG